jgi:hypothetical protein
MSLQKTEEKMIGCADYLTSTEIQTLQQMRDAAAFFTCTCTPDTAIKLFTNPRGGGSEICVHIFRSMYKANHRIILRLIENSFSWLRMEKTRLFSVFPIEECHESFIPIRLV